MLCGLAPLWMASACSDRAMDRCTAAFEARPSEETVRLCEAAHASSGDPRAGAMAARALADLRQGDRALAWVEKLQGTSAEPDAWNVAALVHLDRGEPDLAVRSYRRALGLFARAGQHAGAAKAQYGLFYVAWERSRYREALEAARRSFEEARAADDRELQSLAAEGLYTVLYALGDLAGARRALDLAFELLPPDRAARRGSILLNRGILEIDQERPELARRDIEQALALLDRSDARLFRSAYLSLARVSLARGDLDSAERHLAAAWQHAEPQGPPETALLYYRARIARARHRTDEAAKILAEAFAADPVPDWAWDLEHERGQMEEERGDLRAAEVAYRRSAAIVEEMRREVGFDDLKAWLLDHKRDPLESLFLLQVRTGRATEALATVERAKAQTFQDAFVHATAQIPAAGRDVWTAAGVRADALYDLLPAMSRSPAGALVPVDRALDALRGHRALVYFEARDGLWLLDVEEGKVRPRQLGTTRSRISHLVDRLVAAPDDALLAESLGGLLLPADLRLPAGSTLYVVPDGALVRLPFAALRREGHWLMEDHAVVYVPGLSALAASGREPAAGPPVVLADPRGDLPGAAAEGRDVAQFLGVVPHLGRSATARALEDAAGAWVLHLASHAGQGPGGPWLELADRTVAPAAILASRIRPRLVVLASCASASPAGRGLWGSPGAAFLAAGSEVVLASLGSVEDRLARDFVLRFYQEGGAADPVGGLARAQRAFLAAGRPPSSWASFVLLGRRSF
jgi:tetratricopeptide (TPR) repeat protein